MHQDAVASDRGEQAHLRRADDRSGPYRDVAGLHVVAGAAHVGPGAHASQHRHPRLAAVGPPQWQHRVGQRRHRGAGLNARGLLRLQPARGPRAGFDRSHHRQAEVTLRAFFAIPVTVVADTEDIHTADGVSVDGGLVETGQRALGDDFLGAHQPLRFGDGYPDRPRRHRRGGYPSLLFLDRTHSTPIQSSGAVMTCQQSISPNRSTNHRRNSGP